MVEDRESASVMWPTLGSRTAKEQNIIELAFKVSNRLLKTLELELRFRVVVARLRLEYIVRVNITVRYGKYVRNRDFLTESRGQMSKGKCSRG